MRLIRVLVGLAPILVLVALVQQSVSQTPAPKKAAPAAAAPAQTAAERGKYLVDGVMGCFGCHTDADWSKPGAPPVAGREGSGHVWSDQNLPWLVAPNITPDKETGAGNWSDDTLARAIRD